jgi:hypothetical protein
VVVSNSGGKSREEVSLSLLLIAFVAHPRPSHIVSAHAQAKSLTAPLRTTINSKTLLRMSREISSSSIFFFSVPTRMGRSRIRTAARRCRKKLRMPIRSSIERIPRIAPSQTPGISRRITYFTEGYDMSIKRAPTHPLRLVDTAKIIAHRQLSMRNAAT